MKSSDASYGTFAVTIHWLSAVLIIVLIVSGFRSGFVVDPEVKLSALRVHVPVAILVLLLTVARLVWWWRFDRKPAPLGTAPRWQEVVALWVHRALYLLIFVLLASGIAMSVMSGLPDALFGSAQMPELADLAPRAGHGVAARLIAAAVLLHAGAALYHHVIVKDATLRRMWFSR
ncbi:cytochrome b [Hasllibacter sp. MH4015]|uniref:cytochrome b n=1 Tax=Hasllibacter sp. MH4015 TaxID=2854029 RepID=UPI001CD29238|nr:cytochrome b [Hasllibacter sp. MH4015]